MNETVTKLLWVHAHAPWSEWTNSGASRAFCLELRRRGLLAAALGPDAVSRWYARGPGVGFRTMTRVQRRFPGMFPAPQVWQREEDGTLGRWARSMPAGGAVVYVFQMPEPSPRLKLRRYLFLNLSALDARRTGTFGFTGWEDATFEKFCEHQRRMLSWADGVVTPSTYAAESLVRDFGYPRERITALGYGPATSVESSPEQPLERFSAANILFVGRDWERKGGPIVHEAWRRVRAQIPHATLTIVGPTKAPVEEEGVRFVGYVDKTTRAGMQALRAVYAGASVFCMPTLCEPWGLVFSEAAAMSTPIVSFRDWSLPDVVEDGVSGRLVDRRDADGLAEGLLDVLMDPARAMSMGRAARQRVREVLNWPCCVDRLLSRVMPEAVAGTSVSWMRPEEPTYLGSGGGGAKPYPMPVRGTPMAALVKEART